ncbi:bacterial regulatory s, lacI family protein [Pseudarthrobacter siccitolerans]|uniref:Bacterial regulatory s, lacI family protein n=1 Tax=Pseudarthrobacter siccitolerans TaxID=861266 RepID=A0A024GWV9_9MICC|nr:LacI family DNA-binding transcriptional regulator [Pseudarthrobacter siccitolerans]CCQ44435.1 bacterial regulatory s, lacI family protein [Pseudarthrobacter siccitolerans]
MKSAKTASGRATIYDVAKLVGVNPSTVSRALGQPERVSLKTRKLVQDAVAELNFNVNPLARALPTGRTGLVGLIVSDITNPSYFDIIRGAQSAAAVHGTTLMLAESTESAQTEAIAAQRMQPSTDGIILAGPRMSDPDIIALSEQKPIAVINRHVDGVDSVVPDIEPGINAAVRHLAAQGHHKIAFLSGPDQSWISARRWECLVACCEWMKRETQLIPTTAPTTEGGRIAARNVRASGATAAICYNDLLAIGLMQELQAAAVKVPDDFSVVGIDDIFGSDFTTPALTTIASPLSECGAAALDLVLSALPGSDGNPRVATQRGLHELRATLLVRGSSGKLVAPTQ